MPLSQRGLKAWCFVHKWSSLVSTLFLLLLCVTGLPLIFYEEIAALTHPKVSASLTDTVRDASPTAIIGDALRANAGTVPLYLTWDDASDVETIYAIVAPTVDADDAAMIMLPYDARSGVRFDTPPVNEGVMAFLFDLHANLLLGLAGQMLLGLAGLIFLVAVISGVVVYAPFMRRLAFGVVRRDRSRRVRWLDAHNLTGIVTTAWVVVVGLTGFILAMEMPITLLWQRGQLAELTAPYRDLPVPQTLVPVDDAITTALGAAPEARISFVAWPGTDFSSRHHYLVALKGTTPLSEKLIRVALVDAANGELTAVRDPPWYVTAAFLSAPLHFGDYGQWPLKVVWALLDIAAIFVLISGLVLWRRRPAVPDGAAV